MANTNIPHVTPTDEEVKNYPKLNKPFRDDIVSHFFYSDIYFCLDVLYQ